MRATTKSTIHDALEFLEGVSSEWIHQDHSPPFFFRGQPSTKWPLVPSQYRLRPTPPFEDSLAAERSALREFQRRAPAYSETRCTNELEWLSLMQHHGHPTRLLDWTESYLASLFFALQDADGTTSPRVYMLNPEALNESSLGSAEFDPKDNPVLLRYGDVDDLPEHPAALHLPLNHHRIAAQSGAFTVHGRCKDPVADHCHNDVLAHVTIDAEEAVECRRTLYRMGVKPTTLFPDLENLSREVAARHFE